MDARRAERAHVRTLFLQLLGLIFLAAFTSLGLQVTLLFGNHGLLPACVYLQSLRAGHGFLEAPTLFWVGCGDGALRAAVIAGGVLSVGLVLNLAPRYCLCALWLLYLSFVNIGQDFLSFQWDNLLLEAAFFAVFVTPGGLRPRNPPPPHPIGVFLMLWLVFRLHVESGAAKLLSGDPTWRDLTAMETYYETAPLPTWVGWYAQQMPAWAHRLTALFTFVVEIGLAPLIWGPRQVRGVVFVVMIAMQVSVLLTANYGFFNYLTIALCLFVLDDGHLSWVAARCGLRLRTPPMRLPRRWQTVGLGASAALLVPLSVLPFFPFLRPFDMALLPVRRALNGIRSINAYHLFAQMTLVRREVVIEGSDDGEHWTPYEFRYKPGDPMRAPPCVAPHQPRVDFQLWFLPLNNRAVPLYFANLLERLFDSPATVATLFAHDPFPVQPPQRLRLSWYRYRFTDAATRRTTGAWWDREFLGYSPEFDREALPSR